MYRIRSFGLILEKKKEETLSDGLLVELYTWGTCPPNLL